MAKQFENLSKGSSKMSKGFSGLLVGATDEPKAETQKPLVFKDVLVKGVPADLHRFLKIKATDENTTIAKLLIEAAKAHYGFE